MKFKLGLSVSIFTIDTDILNLNVCADLKTTPTSSLKLNSEFNINIIVLKLPTTRCEFIFKYKSHKNRFITDNNDC